MAARKGSGGTISSAVIQAEVGKLRQGLSVTLAQELLHLFRARKAALFAGGDLPLLKAPGCFMFMGRGFHRMAKRKGKSSTRAAMMINPATVWAREYRAAWSCAFSRFVILGRGVEGLLDEASGLESFTPVFQHARRI